MKLSSFATRDRRALSLGALALTPMLMWVVVFGPFLRQLQEVHERLAASRELLGRELRVVASAPQYAAARAEATQRLDAAQKRLVYATSDASASATLAAYVEEQARESGVEVSSAEATHDSLPSGSLRRLSVRLVGRSDMEGIITLLGALEHGGLLLTVSQLEIETLTASGASVEQIPAPGGSTVTAAHAAPEVLSFRLAVTAFRMPEERRTILGTAVGRVASR
jgi:hypothetical protein